MAAAFESLIEELCVEIDGPRDRERDRRDAEHEARTFAEED